MNLNLTCGSYERMSDTNKLLYLIYGELMQIRQTLDSANLGSLIKELEREAIERSLADPCGGDRASGGVLGRADTPNADTSPTDNAESIEGNKCKYCGDFIEGNRGNLLAHIRKCPERKKEGV